MASRIRCELTLPHQLTVVENRCNLPNSDRAAVIISVRAPSRRTSHRCLIPSMSQRTCWLIDGVLVGHALWVARWLQAGRGPLLRTAFVEAVATDPAYRGQGYATQTMRTLTARPSLIYDLAGLSTGSPGFYARLGWQSWRGPLFVRTEVGLLATPTDSVMILSLPHTPRLDLDGPLSAEWRVGELW